MKIWLPKLFSRSTFPPPPLINFCGYQRVKNLRAPTFAFDVDPNNFLNDTTGFFGTAFTPTSGSVSFSTPSGNFAISQIFLTDASGVGNLDALDFRVPNFGVDSGETISILGGTASFDVPVDFGAFNTGTFNATAFAAPFEFQSQEITVGAAPGASVPFEFSPGLGLLAVGGLIGGSRVLKRRKDIIK